MPREPKPWYRKERDCWFVTIEGKRHNLGSDKKLAFDQFYALMNSKQAPVPAVTRPASQASAESVSFVAVADAFLEWTQRNRAADTYEWYRYRLERFCQKHQTLDLSQLLPHHVQRWVDSYGYLSQSSRRNYVRVVKRCCKWAKRQGYIRENPIEDLDVPGGEAREVYIKRAEFEYLCTFIQDEHFLTLCRITYETGCRPQEILRLQAEHFDEANNRWVLPPSKAKGKKRPRIVYLSPFALESTKTYIAKYKSGHVFRNASGNPWTPDAVNCSFDRLRARMGKAKIAEQGLEVDALALAEVRKTVGRNATLKDLGERQRFKLRCQIARGFAPRYSLYAFRHSWATNALEAGVDALTVATLMGHSDPSTLARVYSHISHNPEHMRKQAQKAIGL